MMTKYQVMEKVGSGNFSTVHVAKNIETGQITAIKIMKTHHNIAIREAHFLKGFDHPNIVKLLDFELNSTKGQSKIVIEYLPENTLQLYEDQQYGLRQQQVKCILFQVALGLAYIHQKGIIHRDIKPENILIDKRKAEIKLIDFGLAISADKINTDYVATRWYRAPQNLLGTKEYSSVIDVFSLACVIVQMYLGNPLFPGTDNIDQLYRIFNILGQPTPVSWLNGFTRYERLGLKIERNRIDPHSRGHNHEAFGLRGLLNTCSPGLLSLLQRMLRLNPKQRITSKEIVLDSYFKDIKAIIPPHIYKRFEKDHLIKKTINRQTIGNTDHYIISARNKIIKNVVKTEPAQIVNPIIIPNKIETNSNHCALINFSMTPRLKINKEEEKQKVTTLKNNASQSSNLQIKKYNQNSKEQSQINGQKYLSFRGINPIKSNKLSMKDIRKNQEINSIDKCSQKESRNNSIDSTQPIDQIINNNLIKKNINSNGGSPAFLVERKTSNDHGKDYRTPQSKKSKSIQRGPPLYSFKGQLSKSNKYIPPAHLILLQSKKNQPAAELKLESKSTYNPNNLMTNNGTSNVKRNNTAINPLTNRMNPSQTPLGFPLKEKQQISRSPSGICLTQVRNTLNIGQANRDQFDKNVKQLINRQQINNQGTQKYKLVSTNTNNQQFKTGKFFLPSPLNTSSSEIKLKSGNIIHPEESFFEFKNKINTITLPKQINVVDFSSQSNRFKPRPEPLEITKKWNSPQNKVKGFKSLEHREKTEIPKSGQIVPQLIDKDKLFQEQRARMKVYLPDKSNLGSPKAIKNKNSNHFNLMGNSQQSLQSAKRQSNRNININLNVNIIQSKNKPQQFKVMMDRGGHF